MAASEAETRDNDWSPDQYLLFRDARNRPIHDLITSLGPDLSPTRIVDLGCGPGNSTELLAARFPHATITGVDSSPAMLAEARRIPFPNGPKTTTFTLADLRSYTPSPPPQAQGEDTGTGTDLIFASAVLHWLPAADRLPTLTRLLLSLPPGGGGVLALQTPANDDEPAWRAMRATAASPGPWRRYFDDLTPEHRPGLDPLESELEYYNALKPHCRAVEMWTTRYVHVLEDGHAGIVERVKGTGLRPFLEVLPAEEGGVREAFLEGYRGGLEAEYPLAEDGGVLFTYPRRFLVAWR